MAKKKEAQSMAELDSANVDAQLRKKFGDGIFVSGSTILERPRKIIPVSPVLDMVLGGGIPEGSFCVVTGPPKVGKLQPLDATVYTHFGPIQMGDIKIGQIVCTPNNERAIVQEIFEFDNKEIFEVEFSDGSVTRCGLEHLWKAKSRYMNSWRVLSLEEILKDGLYEGNSNRLKWEIPVTEQVCFVKPIIEHKIHPYVLGVLLGDGSITENVKLTTADPFIVDKCNSLLDDGFYFKKLSNSNIEYFLCSSGQRNKYKDFLKELNLLGTNSHTKFIPEEYLYTSIEDRIHLLQGLLDTDGDISLDKGNVSFTSTSLELVNNVKELVQGLGGLARIKERYTSYDKIKFFKSYRCRISFNDSSIAFSLPSKAERTRIRKKQPLKRRIKRVTSIGYEPARCIKLSTNDGLYLTDNFIVTHNTTMCLDFAGTAQKPEYNSDFGPRHVYFMNVEGRISERDLRGIKTLNLDDTRFTCVQSEPGHILKAEEYLEILEAYIHTKPGAIFVVDSFSQLCSGSRMGSDYATRFRDDVPLMLADFTKKVSNVLPVNKCILLGITHMIANQAAVAGQSPWSEASGRKIQYQMDVKLKASYRELYPAENPIGQRVHWECFTSALGPPGRKGASFLRYGLGIDKVFEVVELGTDIGLFNKAGAWFTLDDGTKVQGTEKLVDYINSNNLYEHYYTKLREMLGIAYGTTM